MKYTSEYINSISWHEWNKIMANELNEAGFRTSAIEEIKRNVYKRVDDALYAALEESPDLFILGAVYKSPELDYLKRLGLLNNGRCPMCGEKMFCSPGRFSLDNNPAVNFEICQSCVKKGKKNSINPNNSGCLVALLFIPYHLLKSILSYIV